MNSIQLIRKAYQLRQRLVRHTRAGIPACLLFTSVSERNKHAKPNTVTNRMATYRVRAGSIVEPCGRVFHRVEQSPESKECQHLQPAPGGACQIAGHMPPLVVLTTHPHISNVKVANHTPYRPNGCGVPTCACTSLTSVRGLQAQPCPPPPEPSNAVFSPEGLDLKNGRRRRCGRSPNIRP